MPQAWLPKVSEYHKRGISTTLALLDETLCAFELWARGHQARGALYEERNPLSPQERQDILGEIARLRATLEQLKGDLQLRPKALNVATVIWAWCWTLLEPLQELEGRHLRRYGEPPAELVAYLDPKVGELCERLRKIHQIASRARARSEPPGATSPQASEHPSDQANPQQEG